MTPDLHAYYAGAGIIPRPLDLFGSQPQRVVPGPSMTAAGQGHFAPDVGYGKGLTSAVPLSANVRTAPALQTTVPGPYTILATRYP